MRFRNTSQRLRACIAVLAAAALFQGCCGQNAGGPVPAKNTLNVWHWMTDRQKAFDELSRRYEALTGVKVNFELYAPSEAYTQKVRAAAQGSNLPDVFGILGEKRDLASFIKAGHIFDLTPYMTAENSVWKDSFHPKALAFNIFEEANSFGVVPGIYAVPIDITTIQMVYNKDLFKNLGLDPGQPPQTFAEFLNIGEKAKAAGIQGMVCGWAEVWLLNCFASNYAFNMMGRDKVLATIRGDIPYTDEDWIRVLRLFKEMRDRGVLDNGVVTMINKNAEQLFANGKAVFAFNGSWCVNVYKGMNPGLNYGITLPPAASDAHPISIWGGAGSSFMVNARSEHKEEAVRFLQWLTSRDQQLYLSAATLSLPANKDCLAHIPAVLAPFAQYLELTTHPYTWGILEYPEVTEAMGKGIQSIIIKEKTPEQVASEVQDIKERQTAKRRR